MSLGDSLLPDRERDGVSVEMSRPLTVPDRDAVPDPLARPDAALDARFSDLFGAAGRDVRASVSEAAATEGPTAYDRFGANPESFGELTGNRAEADVIGQTLEVFDYSRSVQITEQEGRESNVPGYGSREAEQQETGGEQSMPGGIRRPPGKTADLEQVTQSRGDGPDHLPPDVREAVARIRRSLSTAIHGVGVENLQDAEEALFSLKGDGPRQAIKALGDAELTAWADQLNDSGLMSGSFRGYDDSERTAFYTGLAERLDGVELARFGRAVAETSSSYTPGLNEGQRFASAISFTAAPYVRAEMAENLMLNVHDDPEIAVMVAHTIGSLSASPDIVSTLLQDVPIGELRFLIAESVLLDRSGPAPAQSLLGAIAQTQDAELKSRAFVAASFVRQQAASVLGGQSEDDLQGNGVVSVQAGMLDSMSTLLASQTNDVVQSLRDEYDPNGRALTDYAGAMIDSGNVDALYQDIARLKRGDFHWNDPEAERAATDELADGESRESASVGLEDEIVRFRSQSVNRHEEPVYANAERLGHFVGTVAAAFANRADRLNERPEELGKLLGILDTSVGSAAQQIAQPFADRRVQDLDAIREDVELAAFPHYVDGHRYTGKAGVQDYTEALGRSYEKNKQENE